MARNRRTAKQEHPSGPRLISAEDATLALEDAWGWLANERAMQTVLEVEGHGEIVLVSVHHTEDGRWIVRGRPRGKSRDEAVYFETNGFDGMDCAYYVGTVNGEL